MYSHSGSSALHGSLLIVRWCLQRDRRGLLAFLAVGRDVELVL
jgi:hypothetical protein